MTTKKVVDDEQLGVLARRQSELFRRVAQGTLPIEEVLSGLQRLIEGEFGKTTFMASVVYVQPTFEELKRRLLYVHPDYRGKRFDPIERCKGVSTENRAVAFEYVHMNRDASTDEVLDEMDRRGLRPALYEELLGFAEKYPDEQRKHPIVALGSETDVRGRRLVAVLLGYSDRRLLGNGRFDRKWNTGCRFLAVRKQNGGRDRRYK